MTPTTMGLPAVKNDGWLLYWSFCKHRRCEDEGLNATYMQHDKSSHCKHWI